MKSLVLLRHAQANTASATHQDSDRELTQKGLLDANCIGQKLYSSEIKPDLIIASPAKRTQQTAMIVAALLQYDSLDIVFDERLYDNTLRQIFSVIHEVDNNIQQLMLVSHNPTITDLLHTLCGDSTLHFGPSSVAEIQLSIDRWDEVAENTGVCQQFTSP